MEAYHAIGIIGNGRQTVLTGFIARASSICNGVREVKVVALTQCSPLRLLFARQHHDDVQLFAVLVKTLDGAHQNRFPTNGQKLFRRVASHAKAFPSGNNDDVVHEFMSS